jgi:hypothetical protein
MTQKYLIINVADRYFFISFIPLLSINVFFSDPPALIEFGKMTCLPMFFVYLWKKTNKESLNVY